MAVALTGLWSVLRVEGADAIEFLHAQVTTDVKNLGDEAQFSAYLSPKGRVIALLVIIPQDAGWFVLTHPSLVESLVARLRLFVLRAAVSVAAAPELVVVGDDEPKTEALRSGPLPRLGGAAAAVGWFGGRCLKVVEADAAPKEDGSAAWLARDIALGIPHLSAAASERHIGQMLDLERLGALSFRKGCYPGQEIVARAHYLGKVKRVLARYRAAEPLPPASPVKDGAAAAGEILVTAALPDGGAECLAVVTEAAAGTPLTDDAGHPLEPLLLA